MTRDLEVSPEDDWDQMWLLMMEYYWDLDLVEHLLRALVGVLFVLSLRKYLEYFLGVILRLGKRYV